MEGIFSLEKQKNVKQTVAGFRPLRTCLHTHERFAGTQRPAASRLCQSTGRVSASQCTEPNSSPKGWRTLRPAGQRGAAGRHSLASTESRGGGGPMRTLRFGCKSEKSTFYIRMSINRGTFTVTLRNLHQQDLSPDWVLLILILNTVTIHSSS